MRYQWRVTPIAGREKATVELVDTLLDRVLTRDQVDFPAGSAGVTLPPDSDNPRLALGDNALYPPAQPPGERVYYDAERNQIFQIQDDGRAWINGDLYEPLGTGWVRATAAPGLQLPANSALLAAGVLLLLLWIGRKH